MKSDLRDRAVDLIIAGFLALFPLLPAGPAYLGLEWPWALEAFFLAFLGVGLVILLTSRVGEPAVACQAVDSMRLVRRGYVLWLIPIAAATVVGLLERSPFDGTFWRVEAAGLIGRLGEPMNQVVDPFYPLRVGLFHLEGGVLFSLLSALLSRTAQPARRARTAVRGCLVGLTLVSLIAVGQYVTGAHLHEYWVRANPGLTRSHATLDDPNALASYLVLGVGLAVGIAWSAGSRPCMAIIAVGLAFGALLTTVSRAGWAALMLAGLIGIALLSDALASSGTAIHAWRRLARGIGMCLVLALLLWTVAALILPKRTTPPVAPTNPWEAALQTVDPQEPMEAILKRRHVLWLAGLDLVAGNRGLGAGMGEFPRFLASYPGADGPENAHNYFLQVLAEAGIVGTAGLVLFLFAVRRAVWPYRRDSNLVRARLAVGLSGGLVAFVLTWLTGHPLLNLSNQLWLAAVLAVGSAAVAWPVDTGATNALNPAVLPEPRRRSRLLHPGWLVATASLTLAALVPRLSAISDQDGSISRAAGVYSWESGPASEGAPPDPRFRWTRGRAVLREPIRATVLKVPIYVARPLPATLEFTVGGISVEPIVLSRGGWQTLTYDLPGLLGERWQTTEAITLELTVNSTFVPAQVGPSSDTRELGIGVGVVGWDGRERR